MARDPRRKGMIRREAERAGPGMAVISVSKLAIMRSALSEAEEVHRFLSRAFHEWLEDSRGVTDERFGAWQTDVATEALLEWRRDRWAGMPAEILDEVVTVFTAKIRDLQQHEVVDGRSYECDRCGACCVHENGIEITEADAARDPRIAAAQRSLQLTTARGERCPLLREDNRCSCYETRPDACRWLTAGSDDCQMCRRRAGLPPLQPHAS